MVITLIMAAALQSAATAPARMVPTCSLVTPNGETVGFQLLPWDDGGVVGVVQTRGSVWPRRTLPAGPASIDPPPMGKYWLSFGGRPGLMLELEPAQSAGRQTATLLQRNGRRPGVPLGFGFCEPGTPPTIYAAMIQNGDPLDIDSDIPAFDPSQWPEDRCALLLSDGRRVPFNFRLSGDQVEFSSPELWSRHTISTPIRWLRASGGVQLGVFNRRGGPAGTQTMIVEPGTGLAAKMIYLQRVGDAAAGDRPAYGICGYRGLVRRPAREN